MKTEWTETTHLEENPTSLTIETRYEKKEKGDYKIINKETGEKVGRVYYKESEGFWCSIMKYAGVVARFSSTRKHASKLGIKSYLRNLYRNHEKNIKKEEVVKYEK